MKQYLYSVFDSKTKSWSAPQMMLNRGAATRSWTEACNNAELMVSKYPEDFTMFEIGVFEQDTGLISVYPAPESLGVATQFIRRDTPAPTLPFGKQKGAV